MWNSTVSHCFPEFLCFVCVVTLPAYRFVSNGTRLGMDGYLPWLLAVVAVLLQSLVYLL